MRYFIALLAALTSSPLVAQEARVLVGKVIYEDDPNRTLISKPGWLRGLHFIGDEVDEARRPLIVALIPESREDGSLCARLTSISGNYEAVVQFELAGKGAVEDLGTIVQPMTFATDYPDIIKSVTPIDGGITLTSGECVGDTPERTSYFATFWNNSTDLLGDGEGTVPLTLNMNIARADKIEPYVQLSGTDAGGNQVQRSLADGISCARIEEIDALAFNHRCTVEVPRRDLLSLKDVRIEFSYQAVYRGRSSPARSATIEIGAVR